MKNIFLSFIGLLSFTISQSQSVGIGTPTPHASAQLEINAANKGLLIPRMAQANRPASPATGLLIYQNNNNPGFYYYNGTDWKGLGGPWLENGNKIYNSNTGFVGVGTNNPNYSFQVHHNGEGGINDASIQLTNNWSGSGLNDGLRIRMYNEDDVSISNRENGDFAIVTNSGVTGAVGVPMIWLKPTGAIGIGTSAPTAQLEVAGQVKITGGSPGAGKVLTSDANGLAAWTAPASSSKWISNGNNIYNANSGRVGIGISSPAANLHVNDGADGSLLITNDFTGYTLLDGLRIRMNSLNGSIQNSESGDLFFQTNQGGAGEYGTPSIWIKATGAIGIGTSTPGAKLEISGIGPLQPALNINNGFMKVSGANKTAFTVTGTAENSSGHLLTLSYANQSPTDILIVTHNYNPGGVGGTYHNSAIGVYWAANAWIIYSEDTTTPMLGKGFNVLVIKQ